MLTTYIYTDGGCRGNNKKENLGAWAYIVYVGPIYFSSSGVEKNTTNNRMELKACIEALKEIRAMGYPVILTTDSKFVMEGVNVWSKYWELNQWKTVSGKDVKNQDLWVELLELIKRFPLLNVIHCRGHSDNEGNIKADRLVNEAMDRYLEVENA